MTDDKRFILKSIHFQKMEITVYDHLLKKELNLTLYGLFNLLNSVAKNEYNSNQIQKKMMDATECIGDNVNTYVSTLSLTFKEKDFKTATRFNILLGELLSIALNGVAVLEFKGLEQKGNGL